MPTDRDLTPIDFDLRQYEPRARPYLVLSTVRRELIRHGVLEHDSAEERLLRAVESVFYRIASDEPTPKALTAFRQAAEAVLGETWVDPIYSRESKPTAANTDPGRVQVDELRRVAADAIRLVVQARERDKGTIAALPLAVNMLVQRAIELRWPVLRRPRGKLIARALRRLEPTVRGVAAAVLHDLGLPKDAARDAVRPTRQK